MDHPIADNRVLSQYKPSLLNALAEIALENQNLVLEEDNKIGVPLRLLVEKYILSHWNLFAHSMFLPISSSESEEKPSELRKTFSKIHKKFPSMEAFLEKEAVIYYGRLMDLPLQKEVNAFKSLWEKHLLQMTAKHTLGQKSLEFQPKWKALFLPKAVWAELSRNPGEIRNLTILRWAKDIETYSKGKIGLEEVLVTLGKKPREEETLEKIRSLVLQKEAPECLFSGTQLGEENLSLFPLLVYPKGMGLFLWNLLPIDRMYAEANADSLRKDLAWVHKEDEIKAYWRYLSLERPNRFYFDLEHFLGSQFHRKSWEEVLFHRILESTKQEV